MLKITGCCVLSLFFLTGCVTPKVLNSNPRQVTIGNANGFNDRGQKLADEHCARHGRYAIHRPDQIRDGNATFECIK